MARVTVEDCKKIIPNHFELVALASRRGRDISSGSPILVEKDNDKNAVVALREIAAKKINIELLRNNLLQDFRKTVYMEDSLSDNKQENYLELEDKEASQFDQNFEDDISEEMSDVGVDTDLEEEMLFEDENIDNEN